MVTRRNIKTKRLFNKSKNKKRFNKTKSKKRFNKTKSKRKYGGAALLKNNATTNENNYSNIQFGNTSLTENNGKDIPLTDDKAVNVYLAEQVSSKMPNKNNSLPAHVPKREPLAELPVKQSNPPLNISNAPEPPELNKYLSISGDLFGFLTGMKERTDIFKLYLEDRKTEAGPTKGISTRLSELLKKNVVLQCNNDINGVYFNWIISKHPVSNGPVYDKDSVVLTLTIHTHKRAGEGNMHLHYKLPLIDMRFPIKIMDEKNIEINDGENVFDARRKYKHDKSIMQRYDTLNEIIKNRLKLYAEKYWSLIIGKENWPPRGKSIYTHKRLK
jgi:hypothetical protein